MISCILAAAGSGVRIGFKKQFYEIKNLPVLAYSLKAFEASVVDEIIVVTSKDDILFVEEMAKKYGISKLSAVVSGGNTRAESVMNGLSKVSGDYVLIHDGARPFITTDEINGICSSVLKNDAVVAGYKVVDTIKKIDGDKVSKTIDRSTLFAAATPQGFKTSLIKDAYEKALSMGAVLTDDSSAVELTGHPVHTFLCSDRNVKITTQKDIIFAEAMLEDLL